MSCYTNDRIRHGCYKNTSYGVIVFKKEKEQEKDKQEPNVVRYCLICRKDSFAYCDFIQGKYQLEDKERISDMFSSMTKEEKEQILAATTYNQLWLQFWNKPDQASVSFYKKKEYKLASHKFDMLQKGYNIKVPVTLGIINDVFIKLDIMLQNTAFQPTPEWGFPKGKINKGELPLVCAQRELTEETNMDVRSLHFTEEDIANPLVEKFESNGVNYTHVYYLAMCANSCGGGEHYDIMNKNQCTEISAMGWFTYAECLEKIRSRDTIKRDILSTAHQRVLKVLLK